MNISNEGRNSMKSQLVSQWITSLAISVVCCSVLFIVFAGYIIQLHENNNLLTVRLEMLNDRQNQVETDMAALRRTPVVNLTTNVEKKDEAQDQPAKATSENGMELSETATDDKQKDISKNDASLSATGDVSLPNDAVNPEIKKKIESVKENTIKK